MSDELTKFGKPRRRRKDGSVNPNWGGARPGSGARPKAYRYSALVRLADDEAARALPSIMRRMIAAAEDGDTVAGKYVADRVLGRPAQQTVTPSEDMRVAGVSPETIEAMVFHHLSDRALAEVKRTIIADLMAQGKLDRTTSPDDIEIQQ